MEEFHHTGTEIGRAIAAHHVLEIRYRERLSEVRFGNWTGKLLSELEGDPEWEEWNRFRATLLQLLGMPGDYRLRLDIKPASVSMVQLGSGCPPRVVAVNIAVDGYAGLEDGFS